MVVRGVVIMLDITEMKKLLKASLPHKRFKHSLAVYDTALELAAVYGLDKEKVGVGALLHDCGREIPTRDLLMHTIDQLILEIIPIPDPAASKTLRIARTSSAFCTKDAAI